MIALYLFDNTELNHYIQENQDQKMVPGLIYLDNYDEALDSVEEVRRSLLVALIDRKITKYISNYDGIVKKFETDKYFIVIKNKYLKELQANRFSSSGGGQGCQYRKRDERDLKYRYRHQRRQLSAEL